MQTLPTAAAAANPRRRTPEEKKAQRDAARAERKLKGFRIAVAPHLAAAAALRHGLVPETIPYSPYTDVACEEVEIPYGEVFLGFEGAQRRSHEILPTGGDPTCFIPPHIAYRDREERRNRREAALAYSD